MRAAKDKHEGAIRCHVSDSGYLHRRMRPPGRATGAKQLIARSTANRISGSDADSQPNAIARAFNLKSPLPLEGRARVGVNR